MDNIESEAAKREVQLREIRRKGRNLLKGRERDDFVNISRKYQEHRTDAEQLYRQEYKVRVDIAHRELMHKAGSKQRDFKPSFYGIDRFSKSDLQRQAERNVRLDHQQTMHRLDAAEMKESKGFLDKCSQRKSYLEAFKQTSERRREQTRRQGPERRQSPEYID